MKSKWFRTAARDSSSLSVRSNAQMPYLPSAEEVPPVRLAWLIKRSGRNASSQVSKITYPPSDAQEIHLRTRTHSPRYRGLGLSGGATEGAVSAEARGMPPRVSKATRSSHSAISKELVPLSPATERSPAQKQPQPLPRSFPAARAPLTRRQRAAVVFSRLLKCVRLSFSISISFSAPAASIPERYVLLEGLCPASNFCPWRCRHHGAVSSG